MRDLSQDVKGACACQKMREAARKITRSYDEILRPSGIKATQFTVLAVVTRSEGLTLTELAERQGLERTTLLRNLKPLERKGLIEISAEGYRRARSARITNKGIETLENALPLWRQAQDKLKRRLGDDIWDRVHEELNEVKQLV